MRQLTTYFLLFTFTFQFTLDETLILLSHPHESFHENM